VVASPAYLKARGTPKTPADLASHDCIFGPGNFGRESWTFTRNGTETSVDVRGRIHTNSGPGVFASVMAGLGIAMPTTVMCAAEVKAGSLVPLLRAYKLEPMDVHAVFPGGPRPSTKVRALVDFFGSRTQIARARYHARSGSASSPSVPVGTARCFLMSGRQACHEEASLVALAVDFALVVLGGEVDGH